MRSTPTIAATLLIITFSCTGPRAASPTPRPVRITIDLTVGDDPDGEILLGGVSSVVTDSRGDLYVCDSHLYCVYHLSSDGELLDTFGREGSGPGDLRMFSRLSIDPTDRIYLVGMGGRVDILDTGWTTVGGFSRKHPSLAPRALVILPDGGLAVVAPDVYGETMIDLYAADYAYVKSFCDPFCVDSDWDPRHSGSYAVGHLATDTSFGLTYLQGAPYEVRRFSTGGELLKSTRSGAEKFVPDPPRPKVQGDRVRFYMLWNSSGIEVLPDGRTVTSAFRKDEIGKDEYRTTSRLCIYDPDLELIARSDFEGYFVITGIDRDGRIFLFRRTDEELAVLRAALD